MLILDLLSLARIESGEELFEFEAVSVQAVVAACVERHRPRAEAHGQTLEVDAVRPGRRRRLGRRGGGRADPRQPAGQRPEVHAGGRPHPRQLGRGGRPGVAARSPTTASASPRPTCRGSSSASTAWTRRARADGRHRPGPVDRQAPGRRPCTAPSRRPAASATAPPSPSDCRAGDEGRAGAEVRARGLLKTPSDLHQTYTENP